MKAIEIVFGDQMITAMVKARIMPNDDVRITSTDDVIIIRKDKRKAWIDKWAGVFDKYGELYKNCNPVVTIVCRRHDGGYAVGASLCSNKDTFDLRTGIAVATAKAFHEPIPNYI